MNSFNHLEQDRLPAIADGEWMMIHSDTFVTERERILLKESAFMIDRDLAVAAKGSPAKETFDLLQLLP